MNQPEPHPNQKRLDALRLRASLAMREWSLFAEGGNIMLTAADGPDVETVAVIPDTVSFDNREFILNLPGDLLFLLEQYERLVERYRTAIGAPAMQQEEKPKDFAAECAMKSSDRLFLAYLRECHGADTSDAERINIRIRSVLNIKSRAELNSDAAARDRWLSLRADFDRWRKL